MAQQSSQSKRILDMPQETVDQVIEQNVPSNLSIEANEYMLTGSREPCFMTSVVNAQEWAAYFAFLRTNKQVAVAASAALNRKIKSKGSLLLLDLREITKPVWKPVQAIPTSVVHAPDEFLAVFNRIQIEIPIELRHESDSKRNTFLVYTAVLQKCSAKAGPNIKHQNWTTITPMKDTSSKRAAQLDYVKSNLVEVLLKMEFERFLNNHKSQLESFNASKITMLAHGINRVVHYFNDEHWHLKGPKPDKHGWRMVEITEAAKRLVEPRK